MGKTVKVSLLLLPSFVFLCCPEGEIRSERITLSHGFGGSFLNLFLEVKRETGVTIQKGKSLHDYKQPGDVQPPPPLTHLLYLKTKRSTI